jgi:hypothetical protein
MRERADAAVDHEKSVAERAVFASADCASASEAVALSAYPRKVLVVAKVWLADNDEEIVITATNDTRSRYSAKGGFLRSSALNVEFSCAVWVLSFCRSTHWQGLAQE